MLKWMKDGVFAHLYAMMIVIFLVNFRHYTLQKGSSLYYLPNACSFQRIPDLLVIFFSDEVRLMIIEVVAMFYQFVV